MLGKGGDKGRLRRQLGLSSWELLLVFKIPETWGKTASVPFTSQTKAVLRIACFRSCELTSDTGFSCPLLTLPVGLGHKVRNTLPHEHTAAYYSLPN